MSSVPRGVIRTDEYAAQLRDFSGLEYGSGITPTDLDCFVDFHNLVFVFVEYKYGDAVLLEGQRTALERLCDACNAGGKMAVGLIASHNNAKGKIKCAQAIVTEYYWGGEMATAKPEAHSEGLHG